LFAKIRRLVNHNEFVKDGQFDSETFRVTVDTELKDWEPEEGSETQIYGFGNVSKGNGDEDSSKQEDVIVNRLLRHIGQGTDKA